MKKVIYSILIFELAFLSFYCSKRDDITLKIGALLPLTGSGALYGQYAREGIQIAVDEINTSAGINGKKLEIVIEDNQSNPNSGASAFYSIISKKVPAVLTEFSPVVVACSQIANNTKTVLLNCGAQSPKIRTGGSFVFSIIIDANIEAENMAKFLIDKLKIKEVCTYILNTDTGIDTENRFISEYQNLGGKIILREYHKQSEQDFRSTLLKIKNTGIRTIYLVSLVRESGQILKQSAEIGLKAQWLSYASFQGPDLFTIAGAAAEGAIYTYPTFDSTTTIARNFRISYKNKYGREPEIYASTFYDGIKIVSEAFKSGMITGEEIQNYLKNVKFEGVTGKTEFENGNWVEKAVEFRVIKNGEFVKY